MLMVLMAAPSAHALTYRCELPASQAGEPPEIRYQSQACDGGRPLHKQADLRTDAQRADTLKATQASAKLGQQLERERRRQEKQGAGRQPIAMDKAKPAAKPPTPSTKGTTLKRERPFTAKVPKAKTGPSSNAKSG
ncbi:MAG: hypothetical protein EOP36_16885 [Rubrivivax sp.]|nr:MAG: hypothetical protein EOP36_16885 [Rubrivivax sp.]